MSLKEYAKKRDFKRTPEPAAVEAPPPEGAPHFYIQRHDATRLHYQEITVKGCFHHTPQLVEQALELLATGVVDGGALIDGQIELAQVEDGLQRMARSEAIKLEVIP